MKSKSLYCPICHSYKINTLFTNKERIYGISEKYFYWSRCSLCEAIFLNPTPNKKELIKYYPSNYISKGAQIDTRNNMIQLLYNTYYGDGSKILRILFLPIKSLLRTLPDKGTILDVGCGNGKFLELARKRGLSVFGVDPYIERDIPSLNIRKVALEETNFKEKVFDYITLNNVLEHVQDPIETLIYCRRLLKNNGKIIVNIPSSSSLNYKIFGKNWVSLDTPRHTFIFSNKTMEIVCKKAGLKIKKITDKSEPFTIIGSLFYLFTKRNTLSKSKILSNFLVNILFMPYSLCTNLLNIGDQKEFILELSD